MPVRPNGAAMLTPTERRKLAKLEAKIRAAYEQVLDGLAAHVLTLGKRKLYRESSATLESYLADLLDVTPEVANAVILIAAHKAKRAKVIVDEWDTPPSDAHLFTDDDDEEEGREQKARTPEQRQRQEAAARLRQQKREQRSRQCKTRLRRKADILRNLATGFPDIANEILEEVEIALRKAIF